MKPAKRMRIMRAMQATVLIGGVAFFVLGMLTGTPSPAGPAAVVAVSTAAVCWEAGVIARREKGKP